MITCGIDIGSNTIRMLIAEVQDGKIVREIFSHRAVTRLGRDLQKSGNLSTIGVFQTLSFFKDYVKAIEEHEVERTFAVATSAVREALDGDLFIEQARDIGINIKTLTGEDEASLTLMGVKSGFCADNNYCDIFVYDIGGGSTEVTYAVGGDIIFSESIPLGVVKLNEIYNFDQPVTEGTLNDCRGYISQMFKSVEDKIGNLTVCGVDIVGTAGTVTSVAALDLELRQYDSAKISGHILLKSRLEAILSDISVKTSEEKLKLPSVEKGREDLLVPGILIILHILSIMHSAISHISDYGLREGVTIAAENL